MHKIILLFLMTAVLLISGCSNNTNFSGQKIGTGKIIIPTYDITAPAAGKILGLISETNERITKGQPLFAIADEATDKQAELTATKLAKAKADLKSMEEPAQTKAPAGNLAAAQAQYSAAQQKASKMNSLLAQGAISRRQAQAAQAELAAAQSALIAASQHNILLKPTSPEAIASQKQLIEQLQKEQQAWQEKQQKNEAISPCTGTITEKLLNNNETAAANQKVLSITASDSCSIMLKADPSMAAKLQPQQTVMIHVGKNITFKGQIQKINGNDLTVISEEKPEDITDGTSAEVYLP